MKESYEFIYRLTYDEAYETFFLISMKWSPKARKIIGAILTAITVGMLSVYYLDSRKIHYFFIIIFAILMLYYLIYIPVLKAKKGAKEVARKNGTYKIKLTDKGKIVLSGTDESELLGDKDARAIETKTLFVLRTDKSTTICLPKRIMKQDEIEDVREIIKAYLKYKSI